MHRLARISIGRRAVAAGVAAAAATTAFGLTPVVTSASSDELIGEARCEANRAAGEILFLTGYGYFPSVSVAEVITAQEMGYFEEMCLDVEILPSIPGESMALLSANTVQFAAHSMGPTAAGVAQGAEVTTVLNFGWTPIQSVIVEVDSPITTLEDFDGTVIATTAGSTGVPIRTMLGTVGLIEGEDYLAQAAGYDPFVLTADDIDAAAVYRSSNPFHLAQGGVEVRFFNPEDYGVTATFGSILASTKFIEAHPTAAEDWVRAVLAGWAYASDPAHTEEVIGFSRELTEGDYSDEAETFRWTTERDLVISGALEGHPIGWMDIELVQKELDSIEAAEIIPEVPAAEDVFTNALVDAVHDENGELIYPGPIAE